MNITEIFVDMEIRKLPKRCKDWSYFDEVAARLQKEFPNATVEVADTGEGTRTTPDTDEAYDAVVTIVDGMADSINEADWEQAA